MTRHPATAAYYAPGLAAYAVAQANARIQARIASRTLIDTLPQEVWETADETRVEAGQIAPRRHQINTDAMETDR